MKKGFTYVSILVLLTSFSVSSPRPKPGEEIVYDGKKFEVYMVDLSKDSVEFFHKKQDGTRIRSLANLDTYLSEQGKELLFATNGGMFSPERDPVGMYIENSKVIRKLDQKDGQGNFYLKPNGLFVIYPGRWGKVISTEEFADQPGKPLFATQSGPMLIINDKIHPVFNPKSKSKYIRSGVGQLTSSIFVFAISKEKVTFYDFASMFQKRFGCKNALYLDGAISEMYVKKDSETSPSEKGDFGVLIGHFK